LALLTWQQPPRDEFIEVFDQTDAFAVSRYYADAQAMAGWQLS